MVLKRLFIRGTAVVGRRRGICSVVEGHRIGKILGFSVVEGGRHLHKPFSSQVRDVLRDNNVDNNNNNKNNNKKKKKKKNNNNNKNKDFASSRSDR